jgi:hypothetical protein
MAGFWHLSSTMMFDELGVPAPGAQAFFYAPDVLQQLTVYKDSSLLTPWNQPVSADGFGRMPNVYLDDTAASFYRFRVTDEAGVELIALATIPILSPGASGGGSGVDPTTVLNTGDTWWSPMNGTRAGAVRCNARTIGSATSGATERANADTQALFLFLWQALADTVCPVLPSGRGATAAADFAANKTIGLPDMRGRAAFGIDTMGNSSAGRIGGSIIQPGGSTPGASGGAESGLIGITNLPSHTHPVGTATVQSGSGATVAQPTGASNTGATGGGVALPNMPPTMLGTWFIKL